MKSILKISCVMLLVLTMFSGCDFGGTETVSPEDRLANFESALNQSSRDTIYEHFHSSASMYNQIKAATFWDSMYLSTDYSNFEITSINTGSESNGVIAATATISNSTSTSFTLTLTFKESATGNDVWQILSLILDQGGTFEVIIN